MKVIKPGEKEWEDNSGYSKKTLFDQIGKEGVVFQKVMIKPGETVKSHYHKKQTEIFYFFSDFASWLINGERMTPVKGEILIIEPNDKHEVKNETNQDYLYLAFKFNYDPNDIFWD